MRRDRFQEIQETTQIRLEEELWLAHGVAHPGARSKMNDTCVLVFAEQRADGRTVAKIEREATEPRIALQSLPTRALQQRVLGTNQGIDSVHTLAMGEQTLCHMEADKPCRAS
jgi:hypothetical protein